MIKILHVLNALEIGGLENWLLQVLRKLDRRRFQVDILLHSPKKGFLEEQAADLSRVLRLPHFSNPLFYAREFKRLLIEQGPYQVIHTHLALGGFHLWWAHQVNIPIRIIHTHSDEFNRGKQVPYWRRLGRKISHYLIRRYATVGLAVSRLAAQGRFGTHWDKDPRFHIFPCAIDLTAYDGKVERRRIRQALNIPESSFVMSHVGRFVPEKNHDLLIDIAAEVCQRLPEAYLLLVGDGPLRHYLEDRARALNLTSHIVFTGFRNDIAEILQGAVDLFIFPSKFESAGMALIEAQAAGLPCLISDAIPEEVLVIPELIERIPLNTSLKVWVEAVMQNQHNKNSMNKLDAIRRIRGTIFDIEANIRCLELYYSTTH